MAKKKKMIDPFIEIDDNDDGIDWDEIESYKPTTKKKEKEDPVQEIEDDEDIFGLSIDFDVLRNPEILDPNEVKKKTRKKSTSKRSKVAKPNTDGTESSNRDSDEFYETRFKESLSQIDGMITEIDDFKDETKVDLDALKKSKQRGALTYVSNQTSNITALLGAKLNAIKEKNTVLKNISDLEIKKKAKDGEGSADGRILDALYSKMMNNSAAMEQNQINSMVNAMGMNDYDNAINQQLDNRTRELVGNGQMEMTSSDIAMMYEGSGAKIVILRDPMTNDWRFLAVDNNFNEIRGYPLPDEDVGIKFLQNGTAKDMYNRIYEVMEIPK